MTGPADAPGGPGTPPPAFDHQPYFCEENAWRLCAHPLLAGSEVLVAMVTGARAGWRVRCRRQRAAGPAGVLEWDYHVLVFARPAAVVTATDATAAAASGSLPAAWQAWDLDSTLPLPCTAAEWLSGTFRPPAPVWLLPFFRVFSGAEYRRVLSSDRAHMRTGERWHKPPPPWPAIGESPANLFDLLDPQRPVPGEVLDLAALRARLAGRA